MTSDSTAAESQESVDLVAPEYRSVPKTLGAISSDIGTFLITSVSQDIIMVTLGGQTLAASQYNVVGQELLPSHERD